MQELMLALKLNVKYTPTYITIADTYMFRAKMTGNAQDEREGMAWFKKAHRISPNDFRVYYAKAHFLYIFARYDEAIKAYEQALKLSPGDEMVIEGLANAYNQKAYGLYQSGKNLDLGVRIIEKALTMRPYDGVYLSTKAELLYKMGRFDEAYEYIKNALAYGPESDEIWQDKAMIEKALAQKDSSK
jgi:tetratricopeptide (TPR) repeat protein